MKKGTIACLIIVALSSICYASDNDSGYGTLVAIEVRERGQFNGFVGKLEYTGQTIDIVLFHLSERVIVLPQVCAVLEKAAIAEGIHSVKCRNQYGATFSGTIDFREKAHPKISIVGEGGHVYTNISKEAKQMSMEYIPRIELGF